MQEGPKKLNQFLDKKFFKLHSNKATKIKNNVSYIKKNVETIRANLEINYNKYPKSFTKTTRKLEIFNT